MTPADPTLAEPTLPGPTPAEAFNKLQAEDAANEVRILWSEIGIMALLALLVAIYLIVA